MFRYCSLFVSCLGVPIGLELPSVNDGDAEFSLLQLSARKHKDTSSDNQGSCALVGDAHCHGMFPGTDSCIDFHNLGLSRLFQSQDGYLKAHGYQCFYAAHSRPNAAHTLIGAAVEGIKLIFTTDASACYRNIKFRIEKNGQVLNDWGKRLVTNNRGVQISEWEVPNDEQTIAGTTIKYHAQSATAIHFTGGTAALGNEWSLTVTASGDDYQKSKQCTDEEWKTARPGGTFFQLMNLDFHVTMKNYAADQSTVCGAPDQSLARSPGAAVSIAEGTAEATSIFSQADLDSRCEGCLWYPITQVEGSVRYPWAGNWISELMPFQSDGQPQPYEACLEYFDPTNPVGVCSRFMTVGCTSNFKAEDVCESIRTAPSCHSHPWLGEPPSPQDECAEQTDPACSYARGVELCSPLRTAPAEDQDFFADCVSDWCASCDEDVLGGYNDLIESEDNSDSDSASAVDDPHISPATGRKFDVMSGLKGGQ